MEEDGSLDCVEPPLDSMEPCLDSMEPSLDSMEPSLDSMEPSDYFTNPIVSWGMQKAQIWPRLRTMDCS